MVRGACGQALSLFRLPLPGAGSQGLLAMYCEHVCVSVGSRLFRLHAWACDKACVSCWAVRFAGVAGGCPGEVSLAARPSSRRAVLRGPGSVAHVSRRRWCGCGRGAPLLCEGRLGLGARPPPVSHPWGGQSWPAARPLWARVCGCGDPALVLWGVCPAGCRAPGGCREFAPGGRDLAPC